MSTPTREPAFPRICGCFCRRVLSKENNCWLQEAVLYTLKLPYALASPSPTRLSWAIPSCFASTASLSVLGTGCVLLQSSFQAFSRMLSQTWVAAIMQTNAGKIPQASSATFLGNRSRGKKPQTRATQSCTVLGTGPGLVYGFLESS